MNSYFFYQKTFYNSINKPVVFITVKPEVILFNNTLIMSTFLAFFHDEREVTTIYLAISIL